MVRLPEFWYEHLFVGAYTFAIVFVWRATLSGAYMNCDELLLPRNMGLMALSGITYILLFLVTSYYVWTSIFAYKYPIPLSAYMTVIPGYIVPILILWFLFPPERRQVKELQKRMSYIILHNFNTLIVPICYNIVILLIKGADTYQPIVALLLPALREVYSRISGKLIRNAANGDSCGTLIYLNYGVNTHYCVTLCIVLGSLASDTTSAVLIGVDYSYNLWLTMKIVGTKKRNPRIFLEKIASLQDLAIGELVEFQAPLSFMLVLICAFYG